MSRKSKTLIIILAALVLLGGGYFAATMWGKKKSASEYSAYEPPPKLGNMATPELARMEFPGATIEKINDIWELIYLEGGIPPGGIELDQNSIMYMTYSLSTIWTEGVVDEAPEDLSAYGLANPSVRARVSDTAGQSAVYLLGDIKPTRNGYYFMEEGDPKVYSVPIYLAEYMNNFMDSIRNRTLFGDFDYSILTGLRIESEETLIEIIPRDDSLLSVFIAPFSAFVIRSPYKYMRGTDSEALGKLTAPFKNLAISDFVDDAPLSLVPYGLDKPVRVFLQTEMGSLDLLIGNEIAGKRFAKLVDAPGVFTVIGMEGFIDVKPFGLLDKFALIINIDLVDRLTVSGGEKELAADLRGSGDDVVFTLNGRVTETKSFRSFYQAAIGLLVDAEIPAGAGQALNPVGAGNITIEYHINTPPGARAAITLIPFNRDFYALWQEGTTEFLISRNQVRKIYETADTVDYAE